MSISRCAISVFSALLTVALVTACVPAQPTPAAPAPAAPAPSAAAPTAPTPAAPAAPAPAAPQPPSVIRMIVFPPSAYNWPMHIADAKGWFAEENVKVEFTVVSSTPEQMRYVSTGAVEMAVGVPNMVVTAVDKGAAAVVVTGSVDQQTSTLVARPGLKTMQDLKGAKIAGSGLADITALGVRRTYQAHGMKDDDFTIILAGGSRARYGALVAGSVDAGVLGQPFDLQAIDEGFVPIAPTAHYLKDFPFQVTYAYKPWAEANPKVVAGFARALKRAHEWIYRPENREEAIRYLMEFVEQTPRNIAERVYDMYVVDLKAFSPDASIPRQGMRVVQEIMLEMGEITAPLSPVEKYIDERYYKMAIGQ